MSYKRIPMRDGYGKALLELVAQNPKIIALDADVAKSTRSIWVKEKFPNNFIDVGIAEQDLIGTASGLALGGLLPLTSTYAVFISGRAWDEIRTTVCYNNLNVKIAGAHAGISVGPDGATHQALEDVALMRVLPNMTVVVPCDAEETRKATLALAAINGPCYIRFGREAVPVITDDTTPFELGKARTFRKGSDVAIIANGAMVYESLEVSKILDAEGISVEVINLHTVKPIDTDSVVAAAKKCGCVVTAEEHQIFGGMGSAVAECLAKNYPVPQEFIGINDSFGESGQPQELMDAYGLNQSAIIAAVKKVIARKK